MTSPKRQQHSLKLAMAPLKVAVLDDYQGVSGPAFAALDPASFEVTTFRDTLRPYDHPSTSTAEREALVRRLHPFDIICMPGPSSLPNPLPLPRPSLPRGHYRLTTAKAPCESARPSRSPLSPPSPT